MPLRIGRWLARTFAVGKRAIAHNVKTYGFLTYSRLSSGFPLAFVLRPTLE
jgi:hypothetical protein